MGFPLADLNGHMLIVGKSNTGKSNLLFLIADRLNSLQGNIAVFDPHGNLSSTIISGNRNKELVYLTGRTVQKDGSEIAIHVNPLAGGSETAERTSGWIRDILATDQSISQGSWGPRLEVVFHGLLSLYLSSCRDPSIPDFMSMVLDRKEIQKMAMDSDETVRKMIASLTADWREWNNYVASSVNKLLPLLANSSVRNLFSRGTGSIDMDSQIRSGNSIFVVDVSKGNVSSESVRILSLLVLLMIWNRISAAGSTASAKTYLLIDEAQEIPPSILTTLLNEGRKFGVCVILATQSLSQMDPILVESITANVRNFASFLVSDLDAEKLTASFQSSVIGRETSAVLLGQRLHWCTIWTQGATGMSGPATIMPEFTGHSVDPDVLASIIEKSILKFGSKVEQQSAVKEVSPHNQLVDLFSEKLRKLGFPVKTGKVGTCVPDLITEANGTSVVCEIELSDMEQRSRVLKKLHCYPGRKILYVVEKDHATSLYSMILEFCSCDFQNGLPRERTANVGGTEMRVSSLGDFLLRVSIVERRDNRFYFMRGKGFIPFNATHLAGGSTFEKGIISARNYAQRIALYRYMCDARIAFLSIDEARKMLATTGFAVTEIPENGNSGYVDGSSLFRQ